MIFSKAKNPVFDNFKRIEVQCSGCHVYDFLGTSTNVKYKKGMTAPEAGTVYKPNYPFVNEHYPDWIAVLEAVLTCRDAFTMYELGAGWAPWLVRAALAMKQKYPEKKYHLVGVEGDRTHYKWMIEHFMENGLEPNEHKLINALASSNDGKALFPELDSPDEDYGAAYINSSDAYTDKHGKLYEQNAISINTLLKESKGLIDLMHIDIQGAEYEAIPPAIDYMKEQVRLVMVGTHRSNLMHDEMEIFFTGHGWIPRYIFARNTECLTPWGKINFNDGFQLWENPEYICMQ